MKHNCDLCQANETLPLPGDPSGKIGICKGCGFVYVSERRSVEEVAKAWNGIYSRGGYDPEWPGVKARLFYVATWLDSTISLAGRSILDIGSGNGQFLAYCSGLGALGVGLDPSPDNANKVRARDIACFHGWADRAHPPCGKFDLVTLNWTLENTGDCMSVLEYAKACLAPGGMIAVATGSRIGVPFKKRLSSYLPMDSQYPHDTHCFRWHPNHLNAAFHKIGLAIVADNDFMDRDELVCVAGEKDAPLFMNVTAELVHNYFNTWQREFP